MLHPYWSHQWCGHDCVRHEAGSVLFTAMLACAVADASLPRALQLRSSFLMSCRGCIAGASSLNFAAVLSMPLYIPNTCLGLFHSFDQIRCRVQMLMQLLSREHQMVRPSASPVKAAASQDCPANPPASQCVRFSALQLVGLHPEAACNLSPYALLWSRANQLFHFAAKAQCSLPVFCLEEQ